MSRHDLTLAQESCRGHRTFNPLLTAYSIALSIQQSYHVCYLVNLQYPILLLHLWPAVLYHLASGGYNTPDTMPSTWTGLKGVKLGKAPPAWRPQGLQGGRLCLPCNPSDERYLHYHQFWLSCQPSIYSKTQHSHWDILGVQSTWQLPGSVLCWVYGLSCHCGVGSPLSAYCQLTHMC